jgi:thiol-disulfide isomerase/thioredoxin
MTRATTTLHRPRCLGALALLLLLLWVGVSLPARAGVPPAYAAVVIEPVMSPGRAEFDLNPVLARARREGKWLYVYLGASDCPFCRRYEAFLAQNAAELVPHFAKQYLVVDLRSELSIRAKSLYLKLGASSLPYAEFQTSLGDERARMLVYPSVWLLDGTPKPLMQMPAGTGTFQTVPEQLEILRLEQ